MEKRLIPLTIEEIKRRPKKEWSGLIRKWREWNELKREEDKRERINLTNKIWQFKNSEKYKQLQQQYRLQNKEKIKKQRQKYELKRRDKLREYSLIYYEEHKEEINQRRRLNYQKRKSAKQVSSESNPGRVS